MILFPSFLVLISHAFIVSSENIKERRTKARDRGHLLDLIPAGTNTYYQTDEQRARYYNILNEMNNNEGCTTNTSLITEKYSTTGSFGNTFTIETKSEAIEIYQIDFFTDLLIDVEFHAWTKVGPYEGFEMLEEAWTEIAVGNTRGRGSGAMTPIPRHLFNPVRVDAYSRQSFLIALKTPDIRYIEMDQAGVFIDNEQLSILVGNGVAQYPPFEEEGTFFSPRSWNGAIHYSFRDVCSTAPSIFPSKHPTSLPTTTPTVNPTSIPSIKHSSLPSIALSSLPSLFPSDTPISAPVKRTEFPTYPIVYYEETDATYSFVLEHDNMDDNILLGNVTQIVARTLQDVFKYNTMNENVDEVPFMDLTLAYLIDEGDLGISSIHSVIKDVNANTCISDDSKLACTPVQIIVTLSYKSIINSAEVRYAIHSYAPTIQERLVSFSAKYVGPKTETAEADIRMDGISQDIFNDDVSTEQFEELILDFLIETLDVNATIANVEIVNYTIVEISRRLDSKMHTLAEEEMYSLPSSGRNQTNDVIGDVPLVSEGNMTSNLGAIEVVREREREHLENPKYSLDVTVKITGEYQPPPEIKFNKVVQDSFDNDAEVLVETLRTSGNDKFENITHVEVKRVEKVATPVRPVFDSTLFNTDSIRDTTPTEKESEVPMTFTVYGIIGVAVLGMGIGLLYFWQKKYLLKDPDKDEWEPDDIDDPDTLLQFNRDSIRESRRGLFFNATSRRVMS